MQVWELHDSLARSIGDPLILDNAGTPANYTANDALAVVTLPDGVRYTKALRDTYINKALLKVLQELITGIAKEAPTRTILSRIVETLTPQMSLYDTNLSANDIATGNNLTRNCFMVYSLLGGLEVDIPLYSYRIISESMSTVFYNTATLPMEPLAILTNILPHREFIRPTRYDHDLYFLSYLGYPDDVSLLNPNNNIFYEDTLLPSVLTKAILYAQLDSGELGSAHQSVPLIEFNRGEGR
jgi:hypothetical protein